MEGIIKVTPETLSQTAGEFGTKASSVQTLTGEMMNLINGLSATWNGEASEAYLAKFRGLETDMGKMFRMVDEHSKDLQAMSQEYARAETANANATQGLQNNIIS